MPEVAAPEAPATPVSTASSESFFAAMERHGGFDTEPTPTPAATPEAPAAEAAPETPAAPATAAPAPVEPKPEKPAKGKKGGKAKEPEKAPAEAAAPVAELTEPTPEQKAETLKALALELGMTIDDGKVTTSDRAALRIAKREHEQRIKAAEQDLVNRYNQALEALKPELEKAQAVIKAIDEGDADELAKLAGAKDWNEFQERALAKITDPNWKKIRDLERQVDADKREKEEATQRARQQSEHNSQLEAQRKYRTELSGSMKKSTDPLCREMADDPAFVHAIYQIQRENWDGSATVTAEQALKMMVRGAPLSVRDELKQTYERLHKVFAASPAAPAPAVAAAAPAPSTDKPGQRPRPKTQVVPAATGGAPSPVAPFKNAAERREYNMRRLKEAADEDRRNSA